MKKDYISKLIRMDRNTGDLNIVLMVKKKDWQFGVYPEVSLKEARDKADEVRKKNQRLYLIHQKKKAHYTN